MNLSILGISLKTLAMILMGFIGGSAFMGILAYSNILPGISTSTGDVSESSISGDQSNDIFTPSSEDLDWAYIQLCKGYDGSDECSDPNNVSETLRGMIQENNKVLNDVKRLNTSLFRDVVDHLESFPDMLDNLKNRSNTVDTVAMDVKKILQSIYTIMEQLSSILDILDSLRTTLLQLVNKVDSLGSDLNVVKDSLNTISSRLNSLEESLGVITNSLNTLSEAIVDIQNTINSYWSR